MVRCDGYDGGCGRLSAIGASAHRIRGDVHYIYTPTILSGIVMRRPGSGDRYECNASPIPTVTTHSTRECVTSPAHPPSVYHSLST